MYENHPFTKKQEEAVPSNIGRHGLFKYIYSVERMHLSRLIQSMDTESLTD